MDKILLELARKSIADEPEETDTIDKASMLERYPELIRSGRPL